MRLLYSTIITLVIPFALLRLLWKSKKQPAYRQRFKERLTLNTIAKQHDDLVWIHTVSVGEFLATLPLIERLLEHKVKILLTTTTPSSSALVRDKLANHVIHQYLPLDAPLFVKRFLRAYNPRTAIFVETEIWPNYLHELKKQDIPSLLINARLSQKSFNGYEKLGTFARTTIANISEICCQNAASAERFTLLGGNANAVGNIKFDISTPKNFDTQKAELADLLNSRDNIVVASTHAGEEEIILKAYARSTEKRLLILVPRHPERSREVGEMANKMGLNYRHFSDTTELSPETQVLIIDAFGLLLPLYALTDYAIVGGSFINHGGHNPLEAALFATPCVIGTHHFNFESLIAEMQTNGAISVISQDELFSYCPDESIGDRAHTFLKQNQGATEAYCNRIISYLP